MKIALFYCKFQLKSNTFWGIFVSCVMNMRRPILNHTALLILIEILFSHTETGRWKIVKGDRIQASSDNCPYAYFSSLGITT